MDLLRHLRFFVAVAEERHFGRAAIRLGMTQPPLSQGLRRLEEHLGTRLVDRDSRRVELTAAGAALLPRAERLLADAVALEQTASGLPEARPTLRLGAPHEVAGLLTAALARLRTTSADAGADLAVRVEGSRELLDAVRAGALDVAVVRHPSVVDGTDAGDVVRLPTRLLLPHDARTAGSTAGPRALGDLPLAGPPRRHHPAAHDQVVDTLRRQGHHGRTLDADPEGALLLVAAGLAGTLDVAAGRARVPEGCRAVALPGDPLPLRVRVVRGPGSSSAVAAAAAALEAGLRAVVPPVASGDGRG